MLTKSQIINRRLVPNIFWIVNDKPCDNRHLIEPVRTNEGCQYSYSIEVVEPDESGQQVEMLQYKFDFGCSED